MEYEERTRIATPEGVELELVLAGLASRFIAELFDGLTLLAVLIAMLVVAGLADLVDRAGRRRGRRRLGAAGLLELGALYRGSAADLAYARRRYPGDPVVARLEALVTRGRAVVYGAVHKRASFRAFFLHGYWERLAERPAMIALAWALLLGPAAAGVAWALADPGAAVGIVPGDFSSAHASAIIAGR